MSYLDRLRACHSWQPDDYIPFVLEGDLRPLGWVTHDFARRLADFPAAFEVSGRAVILPVRHGDCATRSAAIAEVLHELRNAGEVPNWRGEDYGVSRRWGEAPLFLMERGAVPLFGVPAYGVHVNGFVATEAGAPRLWVGKRAKHKAVAPGKLDHLVAGGQPHGLGLMENVIKEAAEEASVPGELAARARPVGALRYICARSEGLRNDVAFCFDLELPPDFQPRPGDDEVESFSLWTMAEVLARLRDSDDFKFNVALVNLHFALRHGLLDPDAEADYQQIVEGLSGVFAA
jgi:isopentenyldiphosphate isomerase